MQPLAGTVRGLHLPGCSGPPCVVTPARTEAVTLTSQRWLLRRQQLGAHPVRWTEPRADGQEPRPRLPSPALGSSSSLPTASSGRPRAAHRHRRARRTPGAGWRVRGCRRTEAYSAASQECYCPGPALTRLTERQCAGSAEMPDKPCSRCWTGTGSLWGGREQLILVRPCRPASGLFGAEPSMPGGSSTAWGAGRGPKVWSQYLREDGAGGLDA